MSIFAFLSLAWAAEPGLFLTQAEEADRAAIAPFTSAQAPQALSLSELFPVGPPIVSANVSTLPCPGPETTNGALRDALLEGDEAIGFQYFDDAFAALEDVPIILACLSEPVDTELASRALTRLWGAAALTERSADAEEWLVWAKALNPYAPWDEFLPNTLRARFERAELGSPLRELGVIPSAGDSRSLWLDGRELEGEANALLSEGYHLLQMVDEAGAADSLVLVVPPGDGELRVVFPCALTDDGLAALAEPEQRAVFGRVMRRELGLERELWVVADGAVLYLPERSEDWSTLLVTEPRGLQERRLVVFGGGLAVGMTAASAVLVGQLIGLHSEVDEIGLTPSDEELKHLGRLQERERALTLGLAGTGFAGAAGAGLIVVGLSAGQRAADGEPHADQTLGLRLSGTF